MISTMAHTKSRLSKQGEAEDNERHISAYVYGEFLGETRGYIDLDDLGYDFPDPVFTIDEKTAKVKLESCLV